MKTANFEFSHLAQMMYDQLPASLQADIDRSLKALDGIAPAKWPTKRVREVPDHPGHYILHVNKDWRAFLHIVEGKPREVRDILSATRVDRRVNHAWTCRLQV
jgi:hypothetical protein